MTDKMKFGDIAVPREKSRGYPVMVVVDRDENPVVLWLRKEEPYRSSVDYPHLIDWWAADSWEGWVKDDKAAELDD